MTKPSNDLCYPVLTPFKFRGVVVKPPAFIQMSTDEASEYQEAGVLGGDDVAVLTPEFESDGQPETPQEPSSEAAETDEPSIADDIPEQPAIGVAEVGEEAAALPPEPESNDISQAPTEVPRAPAAPKAPTKSTGKKARQ